MSSLRAKVPNSIALKRNQDGKKRARKRKPLPPELASLTLHNADQVVVKKRKVQEDSDEMVSTATAIVIADEIVDLPGPLTLDQLRDLTRNFGIPNSSKMSTKVCLQGIGAACMRAVGRAKVTSPLEMSQKRYNTLIRLTNVLFHQDFCDSIPMWNTARKNEFVAVGGATMPKFFSDVAQAMLSDDKKLEVIDRYETDNDERIRKHLEAIKEDASDYLVCNGAILQEWTSRMVKGRRQVLANMKSSEEENKDPFDYCDIALKQCKIHRLIGFIPLYYFCIKASKVENFDKLIVEECVREEPLSILTPCESAPVETKTEESKKLDEMLVLLRKMADRDDAVEKSAKALKRQQMRIELLKELEMLETRLQQTDESSGIYSKMKLRKETIENELFK